MFSIRDNMFFSKNAISKYILKKTSYLPNIGLIISIFLYVRTIISYRKIVLQLTSERKNVVYHMILCTSI